MLSVTFLSQGADVKVCLGFQIEMLPAPLGAQHFADTWIYEKTPMKGAKLTCFAKPKNSNRHYFTPPVAGKTKCFIGKTESGFDFLGYTIHPQRMIHCLVDKGRTPGSFADLPEIRCQR